MTNLRKAAQGQHCMVRIPGVCNSNRETTVLAHVRLIGISGMGLKAPDLLGAWACSDCHAYVDTHNDCETKVDFYEGVFRTQAAIIKDGSILTW